MNLKPGAPRGGGVRVMGDDARVATAAGGWRFQGETAEKFGEVAFAGDSMLTLDPDGAAPLLIAVSRGRSSLLTADSGCSITF